MLKLPNNADITNKTILLRVAYDIIPVGDTLPDLSRITATLPTIKHLLENNAKLALLTWVGRPQGKKDSNLSTKLHAQALSKMLNKPVTHLPDCIGTQLQQTIRNSPPQSIFMLENVRFHKEENTHNEDFAKKLSLGFDIFIFDAFPQAHRDTPSTTLIQKYLPTYIGNYTQKEITNLTPLKHNPQRPFTLIIGGSKIKSKLNSINTLLPRTDNILIGGASANPLLSFTGIDIQQSKTQTITKPTWLNSNKIHLPQDFATDKNKILDIGSKTIKNWTNIIHNSKTILWSGPLGLFEQEQFSAGTKKIAQAITSSPTTSIIGGGDTITAINKLSNQTNFTYISLGGTAMLEFIAQDTLPALKNIT